MNGSFSVGEVLSTSLRIWIRNFFTFTLLAAVLYVPVVLYTHDSDVYLGERDGVYTFLLIRYAGGWFFLPNLLTALIAYGVIMALRGRHATFLGSLTNGVRRSLPAMLVAVLMFALILLVWIVILLPSGMAQSLALLYVLMFVSGAVVLSLYCRWYLAVASSVLERPGIAGAFGRSRELTFGQKGAIFGMIFLVVAAKIGLGLLIGHQFPNDSYQEILEYARIQQLTLVGFDVLVSPLFATLPVVTYFALRREKEGIAADDLAQVFE